MKATSPTTPATAGELFADWLGALKPTTRAAYLADLRDLASWIGTVRGFEGITEPGDAVAALVTAGEAIAEGVAMRYRANLIERGLAASTINRRLSALRSVCARLRLPGCPRLRIEVRGVRARAYRNMAGPSIAGVRSMLRAIGQRPASKHRTRDMALLRVLADLGLRRFEVLGLDLEHVEGRKLLVRGKGDATESERTPVTMPESTADALAAWIALRGSERGPLFVGLTGKGKGTRLSGSQLWRIVRDAGLAADLPGPCWPNALRHSAITTAAESGRPTHELRRFSRHRSSAALDAYLDNRQDTAGDIARYVAAMHGSVRDGAD
jgi:integrase/recombinase XerC